MKYLSVSSALQVPPHMGAMCIHWIGTAATNTLHTLNALLVLFVCRFSGSDLLQCLVQRPVKGPGRPAA